MKALHCLPSTYICVHLWGHTLFLSSPSHTHTHSQAHNDLIKTYEAKLRSFGIPTEELGFKPLQSTVTGQTLGEGAAGLVAAPI